MNTELWVLCVDLTLMPFATKRVCSSDSTTDRSVSPATTRIASGLHRQMLLHFISFFISWGYSKAHVYDTCATITFYQTIVVNATCTWLCLLEAWCFIRTFNKRRTTELVSPTYVTTQLPHTLTLLQYLSPATQWAAVRTMDSVTRVPPHRNCQPPPSCTSINTCRHVSTL